MKQFKISIYKFGELSESAKEKVCNKEREDVNGNFGTFAMESDAEERMDTLNAFCKLFGITYRVDYDHQYRFISWQFEDVDMNGYDWCDEDITGKYLLRWLNRYYYSIREKKTYWRNFNGEMRNRTSRFQYSAPDYGCCFTGVCYDLDILQPIINWYLHPDFSITLHDLFDDCFSYFMQQWEKEDDYRMSDEYIGEMISINWDDKWYFADGTEFQGCEDELEEFHNQSGDAA